MNHRHEFSALWTHFGPYGDQSVHYHPCFGEECDRVIIGPQRECDGRKWGHEAFWLTEDGPKRDCELDHYGRDDTDFLRSDVEIVWRCGVADVV